MSYVICLHVCMSFMIYGSLKEGMNKGGKGGSARAYDTVHFEIKHQKAQVHLLMPQRLPTTLGPARLLGSM